MEHTSGLLLHNILNTFGESKLQAFAPKPSEPMSTQWVVFFFFLTPRLSPDWPTTSRSRRLEK